eukprot:CAMPEP_0204620948 /NCGR_PEP_ID=MMETSP0717-20131115/6830_1 /ASSEMBLY_ACC=CAM_ASM_000666 /TAXON_ID=230516 /ORGANISM="Chaetoceros curvisetus" /LENGTH=121 /DNA_ID=CAMNT_0051635259 /DNA_START=21 /DNA_END=383 /DNA_ORIENTATION=+
MPSRKPAFNKRVNQLRAYKQQHGHLNVKDSQDRGLIGYCYRLRKAFGSNSLSRDQIEILQDIGFEFTKDASPVKMPPHRIEELRSFKQKHGHLNVTWTQDRSLHAYCSRLRKAMMSNALDE